MNLLPALPILVPLVAAAAGIVSWRSRGMQAAIAVVGSIAHLIVAVALFQAVWERGFVVLQASGWAPPFGITLVADVAAALLVVLAAGSGLVTILYSTRGISRRLQRRFYFPLVNVMLAGVCGAFLTGDLFNLYVWFEVILMASFVLMALAGERPQLEGSIKYFTLNLLGSLTLLSAVGLLYGVTGTLNMADLAIRVQQVENQGLVLSLAMMLMFAFAVKAAAFPVYFWLPASYHTPPVAVTALFAALLTKVGIYSLLRVFTLIFVQDTAYTHGVLLWIAGLTMVSGVLGALAQTEMRRIFAYHSVSQIGYMLMGIALLTPLGLAGTIVFVVHHSIVKSNLFLITGIVERLRGSTTLDGMGGLYAAAPAASILFLISAGSLAGIPPLSGFAGKLYLVKAGLDAGGYWIVAVALGVSLLTLLSMSKIWIKGFLPAAAPASEPLQPERTAPLAMWAPAAALALLAVILGVLAAPVFNIAMRAAEQLDDRSAYIEAVLGIQAAPDLAQENPR